MQSNSSKKVSFNKLTIIFLAKLKIMFRVIISILFVLVSIFFGSERSTSIADDKIEISLKEAVKIAFTNSPNIKAKYAEWQAAHHQALAVKGSRYPQVNAYADYLRLSDPVAVVPIKGFGGNPPYFSRDLYKTGLAVTYPLYKGGGLRADFKKAVHEEKAQKGLLTAYRHNLVAQLTNTFYTIIYLKSLLDAQNMTFEALKAQRKDAQLAFNVGRIPKLDLMEIDTQLSSQHQDIVATQQAILRSKQQLAWLMGLRPKEKFILKGDLEKEAQKLLRSPDIRRILMEEFNNEEIFQIIENRPDIRAAKQRVLAAKQAVKSAKSLHLPSLALVGDYGRHAGSGLKGNEEVWSFGINLNLNLFSGKTITAKIAQAQSKLLEAKNNLKGLEDEAYFQVVNAISLLKESLERENLAKSVQRTAYEAFRIEKLKYTKGAGTISDVLKAQAEWNRAKASLLKALYDEVAAIIAYQLHTGTILKNFEDYKKEGLGENG